ncbi:unnamed protein product [Ectocarpus sp. 6 AP-2014]
MRPYELDNTTSSSTCARNRSTITSKLLCGSAIRQWCPCCWSSALTLTRKTTGYTAICSSRQFTSLQRQGRPG